MDDAYLAPGCAASVFSDDSSRCSFMMVPVVPVPDGRKPRKLVLCFDGTGNRFNGDDSDSNILKIFRMLDRTADDQFHYYQPGIGTYVASGSLSHTGFRARFSSWYQKAKDSAVGSSFDQHVVGGYRFLMRFYSPGDDIYMFGFSRGAYIARFLAEMLDFIGLLSHGNEEMVKFAWKAFAQWQCRERLGDDATAAERQSRREMFRFMKGFRETFSRPVGRIRFLGLFDTVNSVPRFETAWMQRSKFPYTARSSAHVIRHAVSIDERRAKFRQDLMYQGNPEGHRHHGHRHHHFGELLDELRRPSHSCKQRGERRGEQRGRSGQTDHLAPPQEKHSHRKNRHQNGHENGHSNGGQNGSDDSLGTAYAPYRPRTHSRSRSGSCQSGVSNGSATDVGADDGRQDIDEVWFAGGHADVGGGWEMLADSKSASHIPLAWIVREAMHAGLPFDPDKVAEMGCWIPPESYNMDLKAQPGSNRIPDIQVNGSGPSWTNPFSAEKSPDYGVDAFHDVIDRASSAVIHDSLSFGQGLGVLSVAGWRFMEYLPFRRMDLCPDGSWRPIRWPLPRGEVRDVPSTARVHGSVIRRMKQDESYRPGNIILGGGGRGVRRAPPEYGIGDWVVSSGHGDPIAEIWTRKTE